MSGLCCSVTCLQMFYSWKHISRNLQQETFNHTLGTKFLKPMFQKQNFWNTTSVCLDLGLILERKKKTKLRPTNYTVKGFWVEWRASINERSQAWTCVQLYHTVVCYSCLLIKLTFILHSVTNSWTLPSYLAVNCCRYWLHFMFELKLGSKWLSRCSNSMHIALQMTERLGMWN